MNKDIRRRPITPRGKVVAYGLEVIHDKYGYKFASVVPLCQGDELVEALYRDNNRRDEFTVYEKKWEANFQAEQINIMTDIKKLIMRKEQKENDSERGT